MSDSQYIQPKYRQVQPQRSVNGASFGNGDIHLKWSVSNGEYCDLSKSFIRMRVSITNAAGAVLQATDQISFNQHTLSNMFQNAELRCNGVVISRCIKHVPQISALRSRMDNSTSRNLSLLDSLNNTSPVLAGRAIVDKSAYELVFQPTCLGAWYLSRKLTAVDMELVLTPHGSYQKQFIQSDGADKVHGSAGDFLLNVDDMFLWLSTCRGPRLEDGSTMILDIEDYNCVTTATQSNTSQKQFTVSPSTDKLIVAFQDSKNEYDTQFSSSQFKAAASQELLLQKIMIEYAGIQQPQTDGTQQITATSDRAVQRYLETQVATSAFLDTGGCESYLEWKATGPYYCYDFSKDADDASTQVVVHTTFPAVADVQTLLFSNIRKGVKLTVDQGRVSDVVVQER